MLLAPTAYQRGDTPLATTAAKRALHTDPRRSVVRVRPREPRNTVVLATESAQIGQWLAWWVACGQRAESRIPGQWLVRGRSSGQFQAERLGGVTEPAVVRGGQVQNVGAFAEEVSHVLVAGHDVGGLCGGTGQVVDGGEELDELTRAGSGAALQSNPVSPTSRDRSLAWHRPR
jgi:hypothetical protein